MFDYKCLITKKEAQAIKKTPRNTTAPQTHPSLALLYGLADLLLKQQALKANPGALDLMELGSESEIYRIMPFLSFYNTLT